MARPWQIAAMCALLKAQPDWTMGWFRGPIHVRDTRGVLGKYASAVSSASLGAVTDQNLKL